MNRNGYRLLNIRHLWLSQIGSVKDEQNKISIRNIMYSYNTLQKEITSLETLKKFKKAAKKFLKIEIVVPKVYPIKSIQLHETVSSIMVQYQSTVPIYSIWFQYCVPPSHTNHCPVPVSNIWFQYQSTVSIYSIWFQYCVPPAHTNQHPVPVSTHSFPVPSLNLQ